MTHDILGAAFHADPAPLFSQLRREDPVHWHAGLQTWIVTRHADVARLVTDPELSVDRGGSISRTEDDSARQELAWCSEFIFRWMVFSDPPKHTRLRGAVHRAFSATMSERLRPQVEEITRAALSTVAERGRMEFLTDVAVPVPSMVTTDLLGLPRADADKLKTWTRDTFALLGAGLASGDVVRAAHRSLKALESYFLGVLEERRRLGGDDLLGEIVRSPEGQAMDDDDLVGLAVTLLAGAYETTSHLVGNGVYALLQHEAQLARLLAEPSLIKNAVEEIFRFDGPALSVVRRARKDISLGEATIREGQNVYCMLYAANRDPERYPDPDRFDITRADTRHLGLGHGTHFCLGAALSRIEAAAIISGVFRELEDVKIDREALGAEKPTYVPNLAIRGLASLPLTFRARSATRP